MSAIAKSVAEQAGTFAMAGRKADLVVLSGGGGVEFSGSSDAAQRSAAQQGQVVNTPFTH